MQVCNLSEPEMDFRLLSWWVFRFHGSLHKSRHFMSFYIYLCLYLSISAYHVSGAAPSVCLIHPGYSSKLPVKDKVSSLSVKVTLGDDVKRGRPKGKQ